ncbi:histidinol-phosphate aminotransferase [Methylacidimicrobium cyclopophantes]|uniref:Histidinol-phosphate aminotransferase n=1 Tax=Methylacidimicrobium cyclopophantes TaxID=1041766 RepID=A0A5E6M9S0_9BACT|nr:histidinol-phosphate transaminase [Methylacidimicrobium cyclopophantes]VVM05048.1 histidinol-phosphate aminotransferase [Methylacidimicrobium cyclopophantes]
MTTLEDLVNPGIRSLTPYEPGKPIEELAREQGFAPEEICKLASNENPLGPSPLALQAIREALPHIHLYPDGAGHLLREAIASHHGLAAENVVLGNGSNEIIELLFHVFVLPGIHEVLCSRHAFAVYRLMAQLFDAPCLETPDPEFRHDLSVLRKSIGAQTRLIFLTSPNNPTGCRIPNRELEEFVRAIPPHTVVALDEAYVDFLDDPPPSISWVREGRNIVLLRTFSKMEGLAGLRIGYALAPAPLASWLQRARQPFNTNSLAQAAAIAALKDHAHREQTRRIIREGRIRLEDAFTAEGLTYVPSAANFVMVRVGDGDRLFQSLLRRGWIVRPLRSYGLPEWVRVSIGTPEQMTRFLEVFPAALRESATTPASATG